jgi:hypothetical protein
VPVDRDGDPAAADAARTTRLLVACVAVGFVVGIGVLVFSIWLDWT